MEETKKLFKDVIRYPGRTVAPLQEKSWRLFIILMLINIVPAGALFGIVRFIMDPSTWLFWVFALAVGLLPIIFLFSILEIYYCISRFILKEQDTTRDTKVMGYYFLIAYTLYHIVAAVVILILVPLHQYGIANWFWDVTHVLMVFWVAALCIQAIQQLRSETEFRTMMKVFISVFGGYIIQTVIFLILSKWVINLIFR